MVQQFSGLGRVRDLRKNLGLDCVRYRTTVTQHHIVFYCCMDHHLLQIVSRRMYYCRFDMVLTNTSHNIETRLSHFKTNLRSELRTLKSLNTILSFDLFLYNHFPFFFSELSIPGPGGDNKIGLVRIELRKIHKFRIT